MTDPTLAEAVEAAARVLFCRDHPEDGDLMWPGELSEDTRAVYREDALTVLIVSAPLIAAYARQDERERTATAVARLIRARANATLNDHERLAGRVNERYAILIGKVKTGNALSDDPVATALVDLRARIEALRDEWRAVAASDRIAAGQESGRYDLGWLTGHGVSHGAHADALDALLREGE